MGLRMLGGILLVSGTTIGAAMLALPISTAVAGFFPSLILFVIVWVCMTYTAFLLLEVNLSVQGTPNLVSMARKTLGPWGEGVAWVVYLLLLYSLTGAYLSGSGSLLIEALDDWFNLSLPRWVGPLPFAILFGLLVYVGIKPVDYVNRVLMLGLGVCFVLLVIFLAPQVSPALLMHHHFPYMVVPVSVVVTSFGFHIILPSLVDYFYRDLAKIKLCLIVGSLIPLVVYVIWEVLIQGVIPLTGAYGLLEVMESGQPASQLTRVLSTHTSGGIIALVVGIFSFLAIMTSFLGVTLSLSDFLSDGLRLHHMVRGRLIATLLTFVPPLVFAWVYPNGFLMALGYAGVFVAILLGVMPVLMAWVHRRTGQGKDDYRVWGGKLPLLLVLILSLAVIVLHFMKGGIIELLKEATV